MKNKFIRIHNLFEKITGQKLKMDSYPHRLMIQKLVYLLQCLGVNFRYEFSWYMKGPYSVELTKDAFDFVEKKPKSEKIDLTETEIKAADSLQSSFKQEVKSDEELELLGSLIFIKKDKGIKEKSKIIEKLLSLKPWYDEERAEKMLAKIQQSGLFN